MKKIIALSGLARSGKDSTADILVELLQGKSTKVPMARELKHIAQEYFDFKGSHNIHDREILQKLGTDIIRKRLNKPLFHVQHACDVIDIIQDNYNYIFCPDIRFENEYYYLKAKYGDKLIIINVQRTDENKNDNLTTEQHEHPSETGMNNFKHYDYIIKSKSGLDELEEEIKKEMKDFLEEQNDLPTGQNVIISQIINKEKANHLSDYVGKSGVVISWIRPTKEEKKYKVLFLDSSTAYFKRDELKIQ